MTTKTAADTIDLVNSSAKLLISSVHLDDRLIAVPGGHVARKLRSVRGQLNERISQSISCDQAKCMKVDDLGHRQPGSTAILVVGIKIGGLVAVNDAELRHVARCYCRSGLVEEFGHKVVCDEALIDLLGLKDLKLPLQEPLNI